MITRSRNIIFWCGRELASHARAVGATFTGMDHVKLMCRLPKLDQVKSQFRHLQGKNFHVRLMTMFLFYEIYFYTGLYHYKTMCQRELIH